MIGVCWGKCQLPICMSFCLPVKPSISMLISIYFFLGLSICLPKSPPIYLSFNLSIYSHNYLKIHLPITSIYLAIHSPPTHQSATPKLSEDEPETLTNLPTSTMLNTHKLISSFTSCSFILHFPAI